jgi:hypothetical protein
MRSPEICRIEQTQGGHTGYRLVAEGVWIGGAIAMVFYANVGYDNFARAETAPQQAAAAAWACFQVVVPYVLARAASEILTI